MGTIINPIGFPQYDSPCYTESRHHPSSAHSTTAGKDKRPTSRRYWLAYERANLTLPTVDMPGRVEGRAVIGLAVPSDRPFCPCLLLLIQHAGTRKLNAVRHTASVEQTRSPLLAVDCPRPISHTLLSRCHEGPAVGQKEKNSLLLGS